MQKTLIESFRLSPQQRHLCALPSAEGSFPYRTRVAALLEGPLDMSRLCSALKHMVERYEILRTNFPLLPGFALPAQVIDSETPLLLEVYDVCLLSSQEQEEVLARRREEFLNRPLNLVEGPAWRVMLIHCTPERHWLWWDMAALNADTQTSHVLLQELSRWYTEEEEQDESLQYADLTEWQYEILTSEETSTGRAYWHAAERYLGMTASLPYERPIDHLSSFSPDVLAFELPPVMLIQLQELAQRLDVSETSLLLACWGMLLSRLTAETNLLIGTGYDGRKYEDLADAVGLFAKSLPLSYQFLERAKYSEVVHQVEETMREGYQWQEYFSWQAVEAYKEGTEPFCPFSFSYETVPPPWQTGGVMWSVEAQEMCGERFKVCLNCLRSSQNLLVTLHYDQSAFAQQDMQRLLMQWQTVFGQVLTHPEVALNALQLLSEQERRLILSEWNATQADYPTEQGLHQVFEEQVEYTPDAIALVWEDEQVSYSTLNAQANRLAHYLRRQGVGPDVCVGICLPRTLALIVAVLGVLKASGAYVPLDVTYPAERLALILQDAAIPLLLTQEEVLARLPSMTATGICLEHIQDTLAQETSQRVPWMGAAQNLAYVIYTSGSTGHPKGVMVTHQGLVNYIHWAKQAYSSPKSRGALLHSPIGFDLTVTSLFVPLLTGQPVEVLAEERGAEALTEKLRDRAQWSLLKVTPAHLEAISATDLGQELAELTATLILGGETLWYRTLAWWHQRAPHCRLINEYGPTETVVGCCVYEVGSGDIFAEGVPIGRPIANVQLYVLDESWLPVPVGMMGELYIGGDGVARGYLHRPDLTAERFVPDGFRRASGSRLYRTGDLVRYREDGNLEYLGRSDQQVKLRGYRIELGEIEATLRKQAGVDEAVVVLREDVLGDQRLVAYVVGQEQAMRSPQEVRAELRATLPEYMLPSQVVWIEALPLTPNGKVDRRALPAPGSELVRGASLHQAIEHPLEELLAQIWEGILHRGPVGRRDNFFELGGHSLLATQVVARLRTNLQVELPLRSLFEAPTIAKLRLRVEEALREQEGRPVAPPLVPVSREQRLPLSFAQQRLWFLEQLDPDPIRAASYLIPLAVRFQGTLQLAAFERSLLALIERHESLRTNFVSEQGAPWQRIGTPPPQILVVVDLSGLEPSEREARIHHLSQQERQVPCHLSDGRLLRATLLREEEQRQVLLVTLHHIIADGWSLPLLTSELVRIYRGQVGQETMTLPALPIQYADYAHWQRQWLQGAVLEQQVDYWREQLVGARALELPTDHPRPSRRSARGASVSFGFSTELSAQVKALARQEGVTLFMVLLAGFQSLLSRWSGQDDIVVGTDIANRTREETEGLIGFFVNLLVLRSRFADTPTFREVLGRVREMVLGAYAHQDIPFEKLIESLKLERETAQIPLVQVLFVLQNVPSEPLLELPGLSAQVLENETIAAKFELAMFLYEEAEELRGRVVYSTDLFEEATVQRLAQWFDVILQSIVAAPDSPVDMLEFHLEEEKLRKAEKKDAKKKKALAQMRSHLQDPDDYLDIADLSSDHPKH